MQILISFVDFLPLLHHLKAGTIINGVVHHVQPPAAGDGANAGATTPSGQGTAVANGQGW